MVWKPHVTVAALVEREGRFLMVEEKDGAHIVYNQPAGHLDEGEGLTDAVVRETFEETAWQFRPTSIIGVYRWMNPHNRHTYLRVCFNGVCEKHDAARRLDKGIVRALWLTRGELLELGPRLRSPMVLHCVDDYLAGKHYPLELLNELDGEWPPAL